MNKIYNFLLMLALSFGVAQSLNAQNELGTDDDGFFVQINSPASIAQTIFHGSDADICQWVGQSSSSGDFFWGADVTEDLCGEVVWADDSLGCVPGTKDLTGKIALIRRGTCNFSLKVYHAQKKRAKAAIILNHYGNATDGPCSTYFSAGQLFDGMLIGDSAQAVNIPAIFLERMTGEQIDGALAAGETVNVCFAFPRMFAPTSASMYATPISQVDTMFAITCVYNNRSGAQQTDVNLKAQFFDPTGLHVGDVEYNMPVCEPNVDSFIIFPPFYTPPVLGMHTVVFSNDKFSDTRDTLYHYFEHTEYTMATDNLVNDPGGVGPSNVQFIGAGFFVQSGGLCLMGDVPGKATYATFGISNIDLVYVDGDPGANIIGIWVYKADVDGNDTGDLTGNFTSLQAGLVSHVDYVMNGTEVNDALIHVPLTDINTGAPGVPLDANGAYYVSLSYDGLAAGTGQCVRFRNSLDVDYASFPGYPTTPLYLSPTLFGGGWKGAIVAERLEFEGFTPTIKAVEPKTLDASKVIVTPNPANEFVSLELKLDGLSPSVAVSVLDSKGSMAIASKVEKNYQNGVMNFDVKALPSGIYYLWIRTAEGSAIKQVVVAH